MLSWGPARDEDGSHTTNETKPQRDAKRRAMESLEALNQQEQKHSNMEELMSICWSKPDVSMSISSENNALLPGFCSAMMATSPQERERTLRSAGRFKRSPIVQRPGPRPVGPLNGKAERRRRKGRVVSLTAIFSSFLIFKYFHSFLSKQNVLQGQNAVAKFSKQLGEWVDFQNQAHRVILNVRFSDTNTMLKYAAWPFKKRVSKEECSRKKYTLMLVASPLSHDFIPCVTQKRMW